MTVRSLIVAGVTLVVVLAGLGSGWADSAPSPDGQDAAIAGQSVTPTPIPCTNGPCRMSLAITVADPADVCESQTCTLDLGQKFTLVVNLVSVPAPGYIFAQSYIDFGGNLTYDDSLLTAAEEIVWLDCGVALRTMRDSTPPTPVLSSDVVSHSCLTGLVPPLPVSSFKGRFVEISLACSTSETSSEIWLRPAGHPMALGNGALYISAGENEVQIILEVDHLTVNCLAAQVSTSTPIHTIESPATETTVIDTPAPDTTSTPDGAGLPTPTPAATVTATAPASTPTVVHNRTPLPTFTSTPASQQAGDVNCDGRVDPLDAVLILQLVAGLTPAVPCPSGADASGDGAVDALDAALILQFSAGLIDRLPV